MSSPRHDAALQNWPRTWRYPRDSEPTTAAEAMVVSTDQYATEVGVKVSSDAMQVLGAQGYMMDHPLERHYRDARQLMIVEGTSQIQRVVIARAMLERELVYP